MTSYLLKIKNLQIKIATDGKKKTNKFMIIIDNL